MKVEVLLIAVGIAAASISFMVLKPADILQPFRNAVYKIEVIRDRNADVAKQLGVEIHARSLFLQGLLFLETLPEKLKAAALR